jgi:hypothetical protein
MGSVKEANQREGIWDQDKDGVKIQDFNKKHDNNCYENL